MTRNIFCSFLVKPLKSNLLESETRLQQVWVKKTLGLNLKSNKLEKIIKPFNSEILLRTV